MAIFSTSHKIKNQQAAIDSRILEFYTNTNIPNGFKKKLILLKTLDLSKLDETLSYYTKPY